jgi:hypothetical protein
MKEKHSGLSCITFNKEIYNQDIIIYVNLELCNKKKN